MARLPLPGAQKGWAQLHPFVGVGFTRLNWPLTTCANITQLLGSFLAGLLGAARPLASNLVILLSAVSSLPRVGLGPAALSAWAKSWAEFHPNSV